MKYGSLQQYIIINSTLLINEIPQWRHERCITHHQQIFKEPLQQIHTLILYIYICVCVHTYVFVIINSIRKSISIYQYNNSIKSNIKCTWVDLISLLSCNTALKSRFGRRPRNNCILNRNWSQVYTAQRRTLRLSTLE